MGVVYDYFEELYMQTADDDYYTKIDDNSGDFESPSVGVTIDTMGIRWVDENGSQIPTPNDRAYIYAPNDWTYIDGDWQIGEIDSDMPKQTIKTTPLEEIMEAMVVAEVERRMRQLERRKKVVVKPQEVVVEGDRDIDF